MLDIQLIIFDFDGVLVDSEYIAGAVTTRLLTEFGAKTDLDTVLSQFVGQHVDAIASHLEQHIGKENIQEFKQKSKIENRKAFQEKLAPLPNVLKTLSQISIPMCIGSNSAYDSLLAKLEITKLNAFFPTEKLFVSSMVSKPKPAPDVYLKAAKHHNIAPQNCLVIEDSVHGIHAAKAANMAVIGFYGASHCHPKYEALLKQAGASITFDNIGELPNIINELQRKR